MGRLPGFDGVFVGHATNQSARTGCTVILCPAGAVGGVEVRGGAPATRETDLLRPGNLVQQVHAVLLAGGSAFGLAAADGVMRWLAARGSGFPTGAGNVPIVPSAALFDLGVGQPLPPDAAMGEAACEAALNGDLLWGRVGAGAGATVGKVLGPEKASPGGIGMAALTLADGTVVAAVVAVNALGHVLDDESQRIVAGARDDQGSFADTIAVLLQRDPQHPFAARVGENTTIGCVVTTAPLDKAGCCRVASVAHDGLARVLRPAHTQYDGDTLFVLSSPATDVPPADLTVVGVAATEAVARAIVNAVAGAA